MLLRYKIETAQSFSWLSLRWTKPLRQNQELETETASWFKSNNIPCLSLSCRLSENWDGFFIPFACSHRGDFFIFSNTSQEGKRRGNASLCRPVKILLWRLSITPACHCFWGLYGDSPQTGGFYAALVNHSLVRKAARLRRRKSSAVNIYEP